MFGAILMATNSTFQSDIAIYRSIYMKKVMKLLAFIFEQPSYIAIEHNTKSLIVLLITRVGLKKQTHVSPVIKLVTHQGWCLLIKME